MLFQKCFWGQVKLSFLLLIVVISRQCFTGKSTAISHFTPGRVRVCYVEVPAFWGTSICSSVSLLLLWEVNLLNSAQWLVIPWSQGLIRTWSQGGKSSRNRPCSLLRWAQSPRPGLPTSLPYKHSLQLEGSFLEQAYLPHHCLLSPPHTSWEILPLPEKKDYRLGQGYSQSQVPDKEQLQGLDLLWISKVTGFYNKEWPEIIKLILYPHLREPW